MQKDKDKANFESNYVSLFNLIVNADQIIPKQRINCISGRIDYLLYKSIKGIHCKFLQERNFII